MMNYVRTTHIRTTHMMNYVRNNTLEQHIRNKNLSGTLLSKGHQQQLQFEGNLLSKVPQKKL